MKSDSLQYKQEQDTQPDLNFHSEFALHNQSSKPVYHNEQESTKTKMPPED